MQFEAPDYKPEGAETFKRDVVENETFIENCKKDAHQSCLYKKEYHHQGIVAAWDHEKLVGLICAMDDGIMTAYIHYLLVEPAYHHKGIGKQLVSLMKHKYKDYLRIVIVAYTRVHLELYGE